VSAATPEQAPDSFDSPDGRTYSSPANGATARQADDWGVVVDETKLFAIGGRGSDWWALYQHRMPQERITRLFLGLGGGIWHVACDSKEDAEMLIETMTEQGVHPKPLEVASLAAYRRKLDKRNARTAARLDAVGA
jgi:hypothetical protein